MTKSQKKRLVKIIIAAVLMAAGIALEKLAPGAGADFVNSGAGVGASDALNSAAGADGLGNETGGRFTSMDIAAWTALGIFAVSYLVAGFDVLKKAFGGIFRGQLLDENFLMAVASLGAFALGEYTEGTAVMLFFCVGELFEDYAVNKSRASISELMDIRPDYANLYDPLTKTAKVVDPYDVRIGDFIQVKPGEKVPLDGLVAEGSSSVQTAAITGESVPRDVKQGDEVLSGYVNMTGVLVLEVAKEFDESTASKILELVENAASSKAVTERFVTKFARVYTPAVVGIALLLAILPPVITGQSFGTWIYRALLFLVVSCPCALVISVPLSFFGGIGAASSQGILVKGSNFLEAVANAETIAFDKTGTLTTGEFKVRQVMSAGSGSFKNVEGDNWGLFSDEEVMALAAHAEYFSPHPIAKSIRDAYEEKGGKLDERAVSEVEDASGLGIRAKVNLRRDEAGSESHTVLAGNLRFMEMQGGDIAKCAREAAKEAEEKGISGTLVFVAVGREFAGLIAIGDESKKDAKAAITGLEAWGVEKIVMLTGDRRNAAEKIAAQLGIAPENVFAELLPSGKLEKVQALIAEKSSPKKKVLFAGDGLNDAPVLAGADVGIAMGALGSDAAIEAADVVLMTDEPSKLLDLMEIAKKTLRICRENIAFALGIKFIIMVLGALGLAGMWAAVFADVGVAVLAILNSMRALR